MSYALGKNSMLKLSSVHPNLVKVVKRAIQLTSQDFTVLEGVRSVATQRAYYGKGRTANDLAKVGVPPELAQPDASKVTWTLKSNHFMQPDGYGHAVDICPYPIDWDTLSKFDALAVAMFAAAKELGVRIRWGADWDQDGNPRERGESDSPHFELV